MITHYPRDNDTVFKLIGPLARIIENTSPLDMLLFTMAVERDARNKRANALAVPQNNFVEIGKND